MPVLQKSLQFVSILGAGLLCGTALAVVIPEGVGLLEESWRGEHEHDLDPEPVSLPPSALAHLRFTEAHADESGLNLWRSASLSFVWNF